jgi:hypothetical protein
MKPTADITNFLNAPGSIYAAAYFEKLFQRLKVLSTTGIARATTANVLTRL